MEVYFGWLGVCRGIFCVTFFMGGWGWLEVCLGWINLIDGWVGIFWVNGSERTFSMDELGGR